MRRFLFAGLMLAWLTVRAGAADTVEIKQRWITGKQYVTSTQMSQTTSMAIGPIKTEQATSMTIDTSVAVQPHEDGKRKRLAMKYDRVAMEMSAGDQKLSYDTAKPKEGTDPLDLGKSLGPIIGQELKLLTNENDEVVEVENFDELVKQLAPPGPTTGLDFSKMFSPDALRDLIKQGSLQAYPGKPVVPGETWPFNNKVTMPGAGSVTIKGTYTFKGMADRGGVRCAEVRADGTIVMELDPAGEAGGADGALPGMKLSQGTLKGSVWFDAQLGMARDSELVQEMSMSMKNPLGAGDDIVIPIKQTIRTTLIKVRDVK